MFLSIDSFLYQAYLKYTMEFEKRQKTFYLFMYKNWSFICVFFFKICVAIEVTLVKTI